MIHCISKEASMRAKQRGSCIKGQIWPPLEQNTESWFSPISPNWFNRRIVQVSNSGICFTFFRCYGNKNGRQNWRQIEKLSILAKFKAFSDRFFKN